MIATIIVMTAATMAAPAASAAYSDPFPADRHQLVLLHGRRTLKQAKDELERLYPGQVRFATNGGYFDTKTKVAVDLVVINNEVISGYLFIGRPILAMGATKDAIFTGKGEIPYRKWESYKEIGGFTNALAGDNGPIEPERKANRQIFVKRNGSYLFIQMSNANKGYCDRVISDCGLKTGEYMFLDGGSSMDEGATTTTQIGVIETAPPTDG